MKLLVVSLIFAGMGFAQGERSSRPSTQPQIQPSRLIQDLPEQDVTIVIHLTSAQATAIEKRRVDLWMPVQNPDGSVTLKPSQTSIPDQIIFDLKDYLNQMLTRYPSGKVAAAQAKASAAIKEAQDLADKEGTVLKAQPNLK